MKHFLFSLKPSAQLAAALTLALAASLGQAQTSNRSVRAAQQPTAPAVAPGAVGPGAPRAAGLNSTLPAPAGLASPLPAPAGLTSRFPAGLPSTSPNPAGLSSQAISNPGSSGSGGGGIPVDAGLPPQTNLMGAVSAGGVPAGRQSSGVGSGPYTALEVAQSFLGADGNRDGELTRGEARRLTIMPYSFEEMDRNRDGILSRFEYDDGVR